ncbi:MAG: hypothetical protein WBW94_06695, partial [Anaerolineales bacterium]
NITNIKGELRILRLINDDSDLTPVGIEYIRKYFGPFVVKAVEVRVQGTVTAGPEKNLFADLATLDIPSNHKEKIPNVSPEKNTFALIVVGQSMLELGIYPNDLVIIEHRDELWTPERQDLIVTKYLPHIPKKRMSDSVGSDEYVGPVLKVYAKRFGETGAELEAILGWRRGNERNRRVIKADDIKPIGKVIGLYRDFKKYVAR